MVFLYQDYKKKLELPILLLAYNRPLLIKKVIKSLRKIKPKYLYIACDGPKDFIKKDITLVKETRSVIEDQIDWNCTKKKLYRDKNKGCRFGVSEAITWFFKYVNEGIILEDDCIPHPDFFAFTEELINYYRNNKKIWIISGNNFQNGNWRGDGSYYYSRYPHCWGWATWRDRWEHYSEESVCWKNLKQTNMIQNVFTNKKERIYWSKIFDRLYDKNWPDSWAYRWFLVCQINRGLNVLPNRNLVSNIGFGSEGTHTKNSYAQTKINCLPNEEIGLLPIRHPTFLLRSNDADSYTFFYHFNPPLYLRIIRKIKKFFIDYIKSHFL